MVSRWLWWAPLGVLALWFALTGLRYGWIAATITETDVIMRYAERYVREAGGDAVPDDCAAVPAERPGIWIVVQCKPTGAKKSFDYYVNPLGGDAEGRHSKPMPQWDSQT